MIEPRDTFKSIATGPVSQWTLPEDLPYFRGHFPGTPILPAVGIIDASIYCLQNFTGKTQHAAEAVTNAKFLSPIVPGQSVEIEVKDTGKEWQVDWREAESKRELATLKIRF